MPLSVAIQERERALKEMPTYLPGHPRRISVRTKAIQTMLLSQRHISEESPNNLANSIPPKVIIQISLGELARQSTPLDITSTATPERYRLVDCTQLIENRVLCISEFTHFPSVTYAAISYVWRGNGIGITSGAMGFSVRGAEGADPIGLEVLHDACMAAVACGAAYLWLDRLCIMQTNKQDKQWQIQEMHQLYSLCVTCIVVPGGLQRLVPLDEETQWIHRGWTLQEVVAPPIVAVLVSWTHGPGEVVSRYAGEDYHDDADEVGPNRSAILPLDWVLTACIVGHFWFGGGEQRVLMKAHLFGAQPFGTTSSQDDDAQRPRLPHAAALSFAIYRNFDPRDSNEMKFFCIWQSALMRTSSRPVDMVFSIMGLFGVILDTSAFSENDRIGATIALAREILKQGGQACWLGASFRLPPCPQLSTFPVFPRTSVAGKAFVSIADDLREVSEFMESEYPNDAALGPLPRGSIDEHGYHSFDAQAVCVVSTPSDGEFDALQADVPYDHPSHPTRMMAVDGSTWSIISEADAEKSQSRQSFAILIGFYNGMPASTTENNVRAMLVEEHKPNKFHVRSYFMLSFKSLRWASSWATHSFCVGGPELPGSARQDADEETEPYSGAGF